MSDTGNLGHTNRPDLTDDRSDGRTDRIPPVPPTTGPATTGPATTGATAVVSIDEAADRRPRIDWGPLWAGFVITLATYLVLQLAMVALSLVDVPAQGSDGVWSAIAGLIAFFVGGVVAGATAAWRGSGDGMLHGLILWGLAFAGLLALAALGSGVALGSLDTTTVFDDLSTNLEGVNASDAQEAAGWSLLGICVAAAAAVIGGAVGGSLWNRDRHDGSGARAL